MIQPKPFFQDESLLWYQFANAYGSANYSKLHRSTKQEAMELARQAWKDKKADSEWVQCYIQQHAAPAVISTGGTMKSFFSVVGKKTPKSPSIVPTFHIQKLPNRHGLHSQ